MYIIYVSEKVCNVTEKGPNNVTKKNCNVVCNVINVTLYFYNVTALT
jgi:hypothetical protein